MYPRTKDFTLQSSIDDTSCLATSADGQKWRITALSPASEADQRRFTFERLASTSDKADSEPVEAFRRCSVVTHVGRRGSSHDYGRKLSVGHFSSGMTGVRLPLSSIS